MDDVSEKIELRGLVLSTRPGAKDYWDDRLRQHWGPHGVGSLAYGRNYNRWLYRVRGHAFRGVCRTLRRDPRGARVLDVGCGTGFYLEQWQRRGVASLAGIDISAVAIERLRSQYPGIAFHEGDIGAAAPPLAAGSVDIVSAFDVLFHVVDDDRYANALGNIHTMLTPGGVLLYSDNFIRSAPKSHLDYWKSRSLRDIERALATAGFELCERVPVFVLMNSPVDFESETYGRLWNLAMKVVQRSEAAGFVLGAALYPWELLLRRIAWEGPSTEIAICRKR